VPCSGCAAAPESIAKGVAPDVTFSPPPEQIRSQARLGSPIAVTDVAAASGIAGRTLFKHCRNPKILLSNRDGIERA